MKTVLARSLTLLFIPLWLKYLLVKGCLLWNLSLTSAPWLGEKAGRFEKPSA
jgi:hypothetical protein